MKTKILLLLLMLTSIVYEASAIKIIIRGGGNGRIPRFRTVIVTDDMIKCTGHGNNRCPVDFSSGQSRSTLNWYNLGDVVDYVNEQVNNGNRSGEVKYKDDLPVSWKMIDEENIEIDVTENAIKGLEQYDVK